MGGRNRRILGALSSIHPSVVYTGANKGDSKDRYPVLSSDSTFMPQCNAHVFTHMNAHLKAHIYHKCNGMNMSYMHTSYAFTLYTHTSDTCIHHTCTQFLKTMKMGWEWEKMKNVTWDCVVGGAQHWEIKLKTLNFKSIKNFFKRVIDNYFLRSL